MPRVRRGDNFRRDIPESTSFRYPDDDKRISGKEVSKGAAYIGGSALEGQLRAGIPLPLRALIKGAAPVWDKVKAVANRPTATGQMHRSYLGNKYYDLVI